LICDREIDARRLIAGIGLGVELHRLDGLRQLARAIVIFFSNVEFFPLAGALSQVERLLKVLAGKVRLADGQILVILQGHQGSDAGRSPLTLSACSFRKRHLQLRFFGINASAPRKPSRTIR
jgi:hypothetical protein